VASAGDSDARVQQSRDTQRDRKETVEEDDDYRQRRTLGAQPAAGTRGGRNRRGRHGGCGFIRPAMGNSGMPSGASRPATTPAAQSDLTLASAEA
jgi:hypothetical protein